MISIENEFIRVQVSMHGAELQSVFHKSFEQEYLWNADPAFWGKHSPVLFPIVGSLKEDTYYYKANSYHLTRHGFAREMDFKVEKQDFSSVVLLLTDTEETLKVYPFSFELRIKYALEQEKLSVTYYIKNPGKNEMYFSVGGHPAFAVPVKSGTTYDDYFLEFNEDETLARWPIDAKGLIEKKPIPFLKDSNKLALTKELFYRDALVFKHPTSSIISLKSEKTERGIDFNLDGFPFLGIWAAKNADFVCIEPWCGIADSVDTDQQIENKTGINKLMAEEVFERTWSIKLF